MLEKFFRMKTRLHNLSDNNERKAMVEMWNVDRIIRVFRI